MVFTLIRLIFKVYTVLLFLRIAGSWFPQFHHTKWMRFLAFYTDPFLNIFRRIIPPLGGVVDLSPLLAFFALTFLEKFLLRLFL